MIHSFRISFLALLQGEGSELAQLGSFVCFIAGLARSFSMRIYLLDCC